MRVAASADRECEPRVYAKRRAPFEGAERRTQPNAGPMARVCLTHSSWRLRRHAVTSIRHRPSRRRPRPRRRRRRQRDRVLGARRMSHAGKNSLYGGSSFVSHVLDGGTVRTRAGLWGGGEEGRVEDAAVSNVSDAGGGVRS
ncbi:hypothetical protein GWI33_005788 [Rhynchophorus ferrugineus]|uniref:Uncharacterized protein n=1 Tax=Rhynchophorus ferrugineus TaxID=354439 RepID=A0A834MJL7_RHYFE|nr:hypothetical protein GWI33_005788 [Rhynchophorus ferrugineus]